MPSAAKYPTHLAIGGLPVTALIAFCAAIPAAQPAVVFDARSLTWDERCTVEALQGLVNRRGARLYLNFGYPWDRKWLEVSRERNGLRYEEVHSLSALLKRFARAARGLVVYDPALDGSRYVALTAAGVDNLLPVTEAMLEGRSPALRSGENWPGVDFAAEPDALDLIRSHAGAQATLIPGRGLEVQQTNADPDQAWGFVTLGPVTVDLGRYPFLEVAVASVEPKGARWGIKLTWDRNGDGQMWGPGDDLVLPTENLPPGTHRWNVADLAGIHGPHTFYRIQLHALGLGARVLFRSVRFVSADGHAPPPPKPRRLTDLGLKVQLDLRGRFHDSVAAYRWALKELMPRCDRRFAHAVNGTVEGIRAGCGPFAGFDWPVMHRGFVFNLTCSPERRRSYGDSVVGGSRRQARMYRRILAALDPPAMITGYGEPEGYWCRLLSEHGHYSFHFGDNWSFHTHIKPQRRPVRQKHQFTPRDVVLDPRKFYVCLMTSEGDTMKGPIPFFFGSWFEKERGTTAINWGINPLMGLYFPAMLEYFYDTATDNDYFFAGCSGAGYCYPEHMPNLQQFAEHTRRACRAADITCIDLWGARSRSVLQKYADVAKPLALTANFARPLMQVLAGGIPVIAQPLMYWQHRPAGGTNWQAFFADDQRRAQAVRWVAERIEQIAVRYYPPSVILVYSDLHNYAHHCRLAHEIQQALDPDRFQVVRLDYALAGLRAWARGRVLVGNEGVNERLAWAALAGVPTRVALRLTNVSSRPRQASLVVRAATKPAEHVTVDLKPWETRRVDAIELKLLSGDGLAAVEIEADGCRAEFPVELAVVPCGRKVSRAHLAGVWPGAGLQHAAGQAADDPQALWGQAWSSPPAGAPAAHIVYGTYAEVPPGHYLVAFRLKLLDKAPPELPVADLDLFAGGELASHKTVAIKKLRARDFGQVGRWQWFVLEADWNGPPDMMETRVWWHGRAKLAVDRVAAFRIEPAR